jgi:hypothetical protein
LFGWTFDNVKAHFTDNPLAIGDNVFLYNGHGGVHRYLLVGVVAPAIGKQCRTVVSCSGWSGGKLFYRFGKNYEIPKDQAMPLLLISEIVKRIAGSEDVVLEASIHARDAA